MIIVLCLFILPLLFLLCWFSSRYKMHLRYQFSSFVSVFVLFFIFSFEKYFWPLSSLLLSKPGLSCV